MKRYKKKNFFLLIPFANSVIWPRYLQPSRQSIVKPFQFCFDKHVDSMPPILCHRFYSTRQKKKKIIRRKRIRMHNVLKVYVCYQIAMVECPHNALCIRCEIKCHKLCFLSEFFIQLLQFQLKL